MGGELVPLTYQKERRFQEMKYSIKVNKLNNAEWSTKAFVSLTINDSFKINDITIREAKNGNLFIAMPGYKTNQMDEQGNTVYKNYCYPTTAEFRQELFNKIMEAYKSEKEVVVNPDHKEVDYTINLFACNGSQKIESMARIKFADCFAIDGVKVVASDKGSFVAMPSKAKTGADGKTEYTDICYPVTKEFREQLYTKIIQKNSNIKAQGNVDYEKSTDDIDQFAHDEGLPFR